MTASPNEITGRVRIDGRPAPGQDVLLFAAGSPRLEGIATTDADGAFRLDRPAGADGLVVLAKVRGAVCAPTAAEVPEDGGDLELDVSTDELRELRGTVSGDDALPLTVRLNLVDVDGVPDWLAPLATASGPGAMEQGFAEVQVAADGAFRVLVRPGRWRLAGDRIVLDQARVPGPREPSVIVDRATGGAGQALPGEQWGGFVVDVKDDVDVELAVRHLADDEI